jgi:hypothetical protein
MRKLTYAIFDLKGSKAVIYEPINAQSALETPPVRHWERAVLGAAWHLIRLPVLTLLVILEPIVTLLCGGLALLGVLTTILFVVIHAPHFPAWTMLSVSLGWMLALVFYEGLIRVLSD